MSYVTNVVLHMGHLSDENGELPGVLSQVNAFFGEYRGFVLVDDESPPRG